jgi:hypothetical protein
VYEEFSGGASGGSIFNPATGLSGASQWGFSVYFSSIASSSWDYGTWTVTAP